jgi:hypothetical protein
MNTRNPAPLGRAFISLSIALACVTACSAINVAPASKPTVVISSPPSGSQFSEGADVTIQSTATDSTGIVRVELIVDGATVTADSPPVAGGQSSFSVAQKWKATAGSHTILVRAFNAAHVASDPAGITVSVLPAQATPTSVPTPTAASTAAPTDTPGVTSTPAVGALNGQVTFQFPNDSEKPASNARVEVLGAPALASNADNNGRYTLNQVPAGPQLVFAKNQFGESNPVEVLVPGGGTRNVNIRLLPGGSDLSAPTRIYTGRVTRNGQPVAGAYVWVHGDLGVTTTNRDGRYYLVHWVRKEIDGVKMRRDPLFIIASDGTHWNGVFRAEDPTSPTPDIELNRDQPPSPPRVIYDLVGDANHAVWNGKNGALNFNGNPNDSKGSARYQSNVTLEDKSSPDRVLETYPPRVAGGFIAGVLPKTITIDQNDLLYGIVGFPNGANNANVSFSVRLLPKSGSPKDLTVFSDDYDGRLLTFVIPLADYAGQSGQIELRAFIGNNVADANRAVWVEAKIVRGQ